jgi:hypothetical protein
MISPWGMRGKSIGFADGRWCLRCLALGSPWTVWRPRRRCSLRPLNRVRKGPRHWPHAHTGPIWLAVRGCATGPLRPYGLLRRLGVLPAKARAAPDLDTLALAAATDLPAHPSARGARGGARCRGQPLIGVAAASGPPSGSRLRSASYVGIAPAARAVQSAKPPRSAMNSRRFIRSPCRREARSIAVP